MRIGLGCMRVPDGQPIAAAIDRGAVWLDTARAYEGNEALIASVLASRSEAERARVRIVTKVGMTRPGGGWEPDGRAGTILAQARASREALGRAPDLLLLHAPDPNVPLGTSLRALVRAREEGLAHAIGLSNPSRRELDDLPRDVRIGGIEVALGAKHDAAARAGMIAWCKERGALLFAHTPLGGVDNVGRLARDTMLASIALRHGATPAEVVLAYLLALGDVVVPIPGARRVETAASAMAAAHVVLGADDLAILDARFVGLGAARIPPRAPAHPTGDVTIVMGLSGSGKSTHAEAYVARGYERLNRDLLGGTLGGIANRLDARLGAGATKLVLDNTYLTRAARSEVVRVAHRAGALVRCVFVDASPADARINIASRMLDKYGLLLGGRELKDHGRTDPGLILPAPHARMVREIERPGTDEGFAEIETISFVRAYAPGLVAGAAVPLDADVSQAPPDVPLLVFGWRPNADEAWIAATLSRLRAAAPGRTIELGICAHAEGPPVCWCRPPLPGLWLAFARRHGIDPRASTFVVTSAAHRTMAIELGARTV